MIWVTAILGHFGWLGEEHSHPNGEMKRKTNVCTLQSLDIPLELLHLKNIMIDKQLNLQCLHATPLFQIPAWHSCKRRLQLVQAW